MDILIDTIKDTILIIPILFVMYLCLEYFEHRQTNQRVEYYLTHYGPLLGAVLGIIPQCGFGVLASLLFIEGKMTLGSLISVFIATSDEAIPILLTNPEMYTSLIGIIFIKFIFAIIVGYALIFFLKINLLNIFIPILNILMNILLLLKPFLEHLRFTLLSLP
ncbi:MAG: putative manganese transporter [Longibaculum sp.]